MIRTIFNIGESMFGYIQMFAYGNHLIAHAKQNIQLTRIYVLVM